MSSAGIKIVSPVRGNAEAWAEALRQGQPSLAAHTIERPLREVNVIVNGSRPELVVVETTTPEDLDALEALATAHPDIDYILVAPDSNAGCGRSAPGRPPRPFQNARAR